MLAAFFLAQKEPEMKNLHGVSRTAIPKSLNR